MFTKLSNDGFFSYFLNLKLARKGIFLSFFKIFSFYIIFIMYGNSYFIFCHPPIKLMYTFFCFPLFNVVELFRFYSKDSLSVLE